MERIVLKFGGTSLGNTEKILSVAKIIQQKHKSGVEMLVVVSAMSGTTNDLINRAKTSNFTAIALTVDTIVGGNRERDLYTGMTTPPKLTLKSFPLNLNL